MKKYRKYIATAIVSLSLILPSSFSAVACGPFYDTTPLPDYFQVEVSADGINDALKAENIALWQQQTSVDIPARDIEAVVYGAQYDSVLWPGSIYIVGDGTCDNRFIMWINNTNSSDVARMLKVAKSLQKLREDQASPWYYPADRYSEDESYDEIIAACSEQADGVLAERYGLQRVRALFASGRYDECVGFYNSFFAPLPDSSLMKRMATPYVAGIMSRLGLTGAANEYFASVGDFGSLDCENPIEYMASCNPDAPGLHRRISEIVNGTLYNAPDTVQVRSLLPVALEVAGAGIANDKTFWNFLIAFIEGDYNHNIPVARRWLGVAERTADKGSSVAGYIRAYRALLDARQGRPEHLYDDLRWLESNLTSTTDKASHWCDVIKHLIYEYWVPRMVAGGDSVRAVQLANYADNIYDYKTGHKYDIWTHDISTDIWTMGSRTIDELRASTTDYNVRDYGSYFMQLMLSLPPEVMGKYIARQNSMAPIDKHLNSVGRTDSNFLNDIAATMMLRHGRYAEAADYLSRVSPMYQYTMNVYKGGYLAGDPMIYRGDDQRTWPYIMESDVDAKLHFAQQMAALEQQMRTASTSDERGMAKLSYEIGRLNSFDSCWALTGYWKGWVSSVFVVNEEADPFLYDDMVVQARERWERESQVALDMITDAESAAQAHVMLYNYRTVARRYGDTQTAHILSTSCDHYSDWCM